MIALGLDIGGTKLAAGRVHDDGTLLDVRHAPTPARHGADAVLRASADLLAGLRQGDEIGVGVGSAGVIDVRTGVVAHANANIADWTGAPIARTLAKALGVPVLVDNDVNALALGECRFGAGRGIDHLLYVAVGTGIGGALVLNGRVWHGAHGFAGELGYLDASGVSLEEVASGPGLVRAFRALGGQAASLQEVVAFADAGDAQAAAVLMQGAHLAARVLGPVALALDPQVLVVGGGVAGVARWWGAFEGALRAHTPLLHADIRRAALGVQAGVVGAACLAFDAALYTTWSQA